MAKVSIVIPIYNVEKYLRQCLDSVVNQTLKDIEIICVNDGSKDSSLAIIKEYAAKDERVRIIDKSNSGYGHSMNRGFDMATGEYIGIIESDDYADPDMFEKLYKCAKDNDLDVAKAGFYYYYSIPKEVSTPEPIAAPRMCKRVFCPTELDTLDKVTSFFNIKPTIWSAIYRRDFIRENGIRFNETPGASYQDLSFTFKVWATAKRVKLLHECFVHYRQDNEASSINSPGKVYCVYDEYCEIDRFLASHTEAGDMLRRVKARLKYDSYIWNYERLGDELREEWIKFASEDLGREMTGGYIVKDNFPEYKWEDLELIISNPDAYHARRKAEADGVVLSDGTVKREGIFRKIARLIKKFFRTWRERGFGYAIRRVIGKLQGRHER